LVTSLLMVLALPLFLGLTVAGCGDGATGGAPDGGLPGDAATDGGDGGPRPDLGEGEGEGLAPDLGEGEGEPDGGGDDGPAVADTGFPCISAADCPGCGRCDRGRCVPCECATDDACPTGEICEEHTCIPGCTVSGCLAGQVCDPQLGRCLAESGCRTTDQCPGTTVCDATRCVPAASYAFCQSPALLQPGQAVTVSTRRTRNLTGGSCSRLPAAEAVLSFSLDQPAGVLLRADGQADHFDPLLYLRQGSCSDGPELACQDTPFLYLESLAFATLAPGSYFLFVESFGPAALGEVTVSLELFPEGLCVEDRFEDDDAPEHATLLQLAADQPLALCPGDPDHFRLPLRAGDDLLFHLTGEQGADVHEIQLQLRDPTGQAVPLTESVVETGRRFWARQVGHDGSYVLGLGLAPGVATRVAYRLTYEVFTRHGSTDCRNPSVLVPGEPASGNTRDGASELAPSCTSPVRHTAPEVIYKLRLDEEQSVSLEVDADWPYALALFTGCPGDEEPSEELACRAFAPASGQPLFVPALAAGTYHVVLDGYGDEAGPYTLRVELGAPLLPPANDGCDAPAEIRPGELLIGSTSLGRNDFRGNCTAPLGHFAADVVYRFSLLEERRVVFSLTPEGDDGQPWVAALYVQSVCGSSATELGCDHLGPTLDLLLPAGDYFLIVDGWGDESGPFRLSFETP